MTEWPWYVQVAAGGVIVVVGVWLLLEVAVHILMRVLQPRVARLQWEFAMFARESQKTRPIKRG